MNESVPPETPAIIGGAWRAQESGICAVRGSW